MSGRLIAVVGPSGVGKDSLIAGIVAARPDVRPVRRTITRAAGLPGEDYDAVSDADFETLETEGAFCLAWRAHGLAYGIPRDVLRDVNGGAERIVNLSRGVLAEADRVFPALLVLNVTARRDVLAQRLAARGREDAADIDQRLAQAARPLPDGLHAVEIANDGPLENSVAQAIAALGPVKV
jgi:ribose 1,5-bisphosphokinase